MLISSSAVAFAAFCVWLTVRIVNRRERWAKCILAAIPFLAGVAYVASYACMVSGEWVYMTPSGLYVPDEYYNPLTGRQVDRKWNTVFAPINWLDRKIRREEWSPQVTDDP